MSVSPDYTNFVKERLEPLGPITHRRMFGGAGVYAQGYIIALLDDDELYFKTDDESRQTFVDAGCTPFTYQKKDGTVGVMTYFKAPEQVFDDPDEMIAWGRLALDASLRASKAKPKPQSTAKSKP